MVSAEPQYEARGREGMGAVVLAKHRLELTTQLSATQADALADAPKRPKVGLARIARSSGFERPLALAVTFGVVIVNSGGTKACDSTV